MYDWGQIQCTACARTNTNRCPIVVSYIAIPTQIIIVRHRELVAIAGPTKTTTRMHLSPVRWCFAPLPYWSELPRGPWLVCRHVFHRHHAVSGVGIHEQMIRAKKGSAPNNTNMTPETKAPEDGEHTVNYRVDDGVLPSGRRRRPRCVDIIKFYIGCHLFPRLDLLARHKNRYL